MILFIILFTNPYFNNLYCKISYAYSNCYFRCFLFAAPLFLINIHKQLIISMSALKRTSSSPHRHHAQFHPHVGLVIDDRFKITKILRNSSHNTICACEIIVAEKSKKGESNGKGDFVIKLQKKVMNHKKRKCYEFLRNQCTIYHALESYSTKSSKINPQGGFSRLIACGISGGLSYLVLDRFANSLEKIFVEFNRKFTVRTVLNIGIQAVRILEKLHKKGYIHRDIRPENFLIGPGNNKDQLYLIDFSLARKYVSKDGDLIPEKNHLKFIGTVRYASIASHFGKSQTRRQDLQSLAYMLAYLLKGRLPWQGFKNRFHMEDKGFEDLIGYIGHEKNYVNIEQLFNTTEDNTGYTSTSLQAFLSEIRCLKSTQRPEYKRYMRLMREQEEAIAKQVQILKLGDSKGKCAIMGSEQPFDWLSEKLMKKVANSKLREASEEGHSKQMKSQPLFDKQVKHHSSNSKKASSSTEKQGSNKKKRPFIISRSPMDKNSKNQ